MTRPSCTTSRVRSRRLGRERWQPDIGRRGSILATSQGHGGEGRSGGGERGEPAGDRQLDGGRARRHGRSRRLSLGGGSGTGPDRGSGSEMTSETSTKQRFVASTYPGFENKGA